MTTPLILGAYRCDSCRVRFPLKQLKRCGACQIPVYCSTSCQKVSWKEGHKKLCREVVVEKKLFNGWWHVWYDLLGWTTTRAFDLTNRPGDNHNHCLEITLGKTGSNDVCRAYEVVSARLQTLKMDDAGFHEYDSRMANEGRHNRFYLNLLVEGELTDTAGLVWAPQTFIHDTPERSELQSKHCIDVLRAVVRNGKPRDAIMQGTLAMETAIMREGVSPASPIPSA